MKLNQNDLEYLQDLMQKKSLTAAQANIEMVRMARVRIIVGSLPFSVRNALNSAVKNGELCHKKKDNLLPEVYYHPNFEHLANGERNKIAREAVTSISKVLAYGESDEY